MTTWVDDFLSDLEPVPCSAPDGFPAGFECVRLYNQQSPNGLEVLLVSAAASAAKGPTKGNMRTAWEKRRAGRACPVLLLVGYPAEAGAPGEHLLAVCGPVGERPVVYRDLEVSRMERIARTALREPTHHAATRFLLGTLPELGKDLPGLRNVGLFATQELLAGVRDRRDWEASTAKAVPLLAKRGRDLVQGLGFDVQPLATNASRLTVSGGNRSPRAVAVFLDEGESFAASSTRFGTSPVSYALARADQESAPWVVLTRASEIRLYAARADTGVGRKGRAETFVEANLSLLPEDRAGYLQLLFSSEALADEGSVDEILDRSEDFAAELASRLRERIYSETVPGLATALAKRMGENPTEEALARAYEQIMIILFRLLFIIYAEDKDLLPFRTNGGYAENSLSRIARRLADERRAGRLIFDDGATDLWTNLRQLWNAVDQGEESWGVPSYNGGLFASGDVATRAGRELAALELTDAELGPALAAMLVDEGPEGPGPVDFRSLSVREFGTIYEGLLESELSIAPCDLVVDKKGSYVPAQVDAAAAVIVESGAVYLHNRSGARKATGSYFTKPFAVEHLLNQALDRALDEHIVRLDSLRKRSNDAGVAEAFFDFHCADIAMGSGHFLVAAVDRIEARLSAYLALNQVPAVSAELKRLRDAAASAFGGGIEIETASLLRRQVARRCIYGVDRNNIAVELARLSIWIHTFVGGLPLSFLDHNLVFGDSLTGVGSLAEVSQAFNRDADPKAASLYRTDLENMLSTAQEALFRLARTSDATKGEIDDARSAHESALEAVSGARAVFDVVSAARAGVTALPEKFVEATFTKIAGLPEVQDTIRQLVPLHFPATFPEIFLRDRPGFDCLLGNPPWKEAVVEERGFWALRLPGLRAKAQAQQQKEISSLRQSRPDLVAEYNNEVTAASKVRKLLMAGPFPGMGTGDPDLYKAFCWRFWHLTREGGAIGVVLPHSALAAKGSAPWRQTVLREGSFADVTIGTNTAGWMFDDVGPQYTIGLVSILKGDQHAGDIQLRGPYTSLAAYRAAMAAVAPVKVSVSEFSTWTDTASFPKFPTAEAVATFRKLRAHPRLDSTDRPWRARPMSEFHATNDKGRFVLDEKDAPVDAWPVYKGGSFNLWNPDTGGRYAWADPSVVVPVLRARRIRANKNLRSAVAEFPADWASDESTLPCLNPRIAFRDVARATDTRTVIVALVPGELVATNTAPYLLWPAGTAADAAFVLGVLSSMVLDWFARRRVELHLNFYIFNELPIPDVAPATSPPANRVAQIAGRLAAVDDRFAAWAAAVGVPVGSVRTDAEKADLIAELDAVVAHLYGLNEHDLEVIFTTFHGAADYSQRHADVLAHFRRLP